MPESALETEEKKIVIRKAIDNLPNRLRETFILYFDRELSYPEIANSKIFPIRTSVRYLPSAGNFARGVKRLFY